MNYVLLDTNAYLRLAKRIKPLLGIEFGQKKYSLTVLTHVEAEVNRNSTLQFKFPWFNNEALHQERLAKGVRLTAAQKTSIQVAISIFNGHINANIDDYTKQYRSPPSTTDCYSLAFGQIRPAVVVTDDLGMHKLAEDFGLPVWHGYELLKKMLSAKVIDKSLIREIYEALEANDDLPKTWQDAKHNDFKRIFGKKPSST